MWTGIRAATFAMILSAFTAGAPLSALAQTAPLADDPATLQQDGDQRDREFNPFLSSSDAKPFDPPPFSRGIGNNGRRITGGDDFDFDSLQAPGQRGSRRSGSSVQGER